jgi:hypothetical protein
MIKTRMLPAAVMVFASGLIGAAKADLIANGGFETGDFTGWVVNSRCCTSVQPFGGMGGYAAEQGNDYAALGTVAVLGTISQTFTDVAGRTLAISYFLRSNGTSPNEFRAAFDGQTLFDQVDIPPQPYTEYVFRVTATGSDTLTFYERDDPNWLALDAVSVDELAIPEPASGAMLCGGLLGLSMIRRRRHG